MWTRVRLDIGWLDLAATLWISLRLFLFPQSRKLAIDRTRQAWSRDEQVLLTLSVRSGFDLLLRALRLPVGAEVLMSAWTIPDMVRVVQSHGLVPVPVDVDRYGRVDLESLRGAIRPESKILVVAHLFGGRVPMDQIAQLAKQHNLLLVEDCAQAFDRVGDMGHEASDIVMHSFGPIKTSTALGGAVVRVADRQVFDSMRTLLQSDPIQRTRPFVMRVLRFSVLKFLTTRLVFAILWCLLRRLGIDCDRLMNSLGRGFSASDLLQQLRMQPSQVLLYLLSRRWENYDFGRISRRMELAMILDGNVGADSFGFSTRWVYPLFVSNPSQLQSDLNEAGFDATSLSRMCVVPTLHDGRSAIMAQNCHDHLLFVPWYPDLTEHSVRQMAAIVRESTKMVVEHCEREIKEPSRSSFHEASPSNTQPTTSVQ